MIRQNRIFALDSVAFVVPVALFKEGECLQIQKKATSVTPIA